MHTQLKLVILLTAVAAFASCGGGSSSSACAPFRILNGEVCDDSISAVVRINTFDSLCTGVIISPNELMTAAHCIPRIFRGIDIIASNGDRTYTNQAFSPSVWFSTRHSSADVVVAAIDPAFVERNGIEPIRASAAISLDDLIGRNIIVAGYGSVGANVQNSSPHPISTFMTVTAVGDGTFIAANTESQRTGNACPGDSGGPAMMRNSGGEYVVVGIVSRGAFSRDCDSDPFTVFTFMGSDPVIGLFNHFGYDLFF